MTRREAREQAFILIFEMTVTGKSSDDILVDAADARDFVIDKFSSRIFLGTEKNLEKLDSMISDHIKGWSIKRLAKTTLTILRLAVYELLFEDDVPVSVTINEAVELAKIYGEKDAPSYVNGVLSSVEKEIKTVGK